MQRPRLDNPDGAFDFVCQRIVRLSYNLSSSLDSTIIDYAHNEADTTGKRFSENRMRKSDWVVDCREAARLRREKMSAADIGERFNLSRRVQLYIAVGFYPQEFWDFILNHPGVIQNLAFKPDVEDSLYLRIPPAYELQVAKGGHAGTELTPEDYAKFDYSEVLQYFEKIADGTLDDREKIAFWDMVQQGVTE